MQAQQASKQAQAAKQACAAAEEARRVKAEASASELRDKLAAATQLLASAREAQGRSAAEVQNQAAAAAAAAAAHQVPALATSALTSQHGTYPLASAQQICTLSTTI